LQMRSLECARPNVETEATINVRNLLWKIEKDRATSEVEVEIEIEQEIV